MNTVQIVSEGMGEAFVRLRLKDQAKSLAMIGEDADLSDLRQLRAPLVDYEVRGLPALTYFGGMVWRDAIDDYAQGAPDEASSYLPPFGVDCTLLCCNAMRPDKRCMLRSRHAHGVKIQYKTIFAALGVPVGNSHLLITAEFLLTKSC